jgi:hypothetical protein
MKKFLLNLALLCFGASLHSGAQTIVLSQNFEGGSIAPWTASTTGGGPGWTVTSGNVNWQIGTCQAHSQYAIVNDINTTGSSYDNPAKLTSPTFSLVGVSSPYLVYDLRYLEAYIPSSGIHERGWVQISTDGGTNYTTIDSFHYQSDNIWDRKFISLASVTPTATCVLQFVYQDNGGHIIGAAIDNIQVYGAAATDIAIFSVAPLAGATNDYFQVGTGATFSGVVANHGSGAISSFTAYYQVGSGTPVSNTIATSVPAFSTAAFSFTTPYTVATASNQTVKIWVTASGETYLNNDTMTTAINGVAFSPKKRMLFEEGTGAWCGFCVRGIIYMDSLWKLHPDDVSIVSIHDAINGPDAMANDNTTTTKYDAFITGSISGYPSMVIDRRYVDDPSGALTDFTNDHTSFGFVNMGITATTTGGVINATVKVEPALTLSGDYRLELIVEEDTVSGTASGYAQHNYYGIGGSFNSTPMFGCGYNFNTLPQVIPAGTIKFPFVARYTVPNDLTTTQGGVAGSLPATMAVGNVYSYSFSPITIPSTWNASRLRMVAMMIDNNSTSASYHQVLNSVNTSSSPFVYMNDGVVNVNESAIAGVKVFPNPTSDDAHVQFELKNASTVHFSVYDVIGREVFTVPAEQMNAGGQQINFSTATLAAGIYSVVIRTENGQVSERLSVTK